jgi:hypothetical protein
MKTLNLHETNTVSGGAIDKAALRAKLLNGHNSKMTGVAEKSEVQRQAAYNHLESFKNRIKEEYSPANLAKKAAKAAWNKVWG